MNVRLKLFSLAKDLAGFGETGLELPSDATVLSVMRHLEGVNPEFVNLESSLRFAVNCEYVDSQQRLHDNDEVAVIPPVSGG